MLSQVAMGAVDEALEAAGPDGSVKEVRFVLFNELLFDVFAEAAKKVSVKAAAAQPAEAAGPTEEVEETGQIKELEEEAEQVEEAKEAPAAEMEGEPAAGMVVEAKVKSDIATEL